MSIKESDEAEENCRLTAAGDDKLARGPCFETLRFILDSPRLSKDY